MKWIKEHHKIHILILGICIIVVSVLIFVTSYLKDNKSVYEGRYVSTRKESSSSLWVEPEYVWDEQEEIEDIIYSDTTDSLSESQEYDTEVKSVLTVKETDEGILLELEETETHIYTNTEKYVYNHYTFPVIKKEDINNNRAFSITCDTNNSETYALVAFSKYGVFLSMDENLIYHNTTITDVLDSFFSYSEYSNPYQMAQMFTREGYDIDEIYSILLHIMTAIYILLWIPVILSMFLTKKIIPCAISLGGAAVLSGVISLVCYSPDFQGKYHFNTESPYLYDVTYRPYSITTDEMYPFDSCLYLIPDNGSENKYPDGYFIIYSPEDGTREGCVMIHAKSLSEDSVECPSYLAVSVLSTPESVAQVDAGMEKEAYFTETITGMEFVYDEKEDAEIRTIYSDEWGIGRFLGIIVMFPAIFNAGFFLIRYIKWRKYVKLHPYIPYGRYVIKGIDYMDESFSYMKKYLETQRNGDLIEVLPEKYLNNDERIDNPVYTAISKEKVSDNTELFGFKRIKDGLDITDSEGIYTDSEIYYNRKNVYLASKAGDRVVAVFRLGVKYET